jgi:steroid 5-alpha reductase family enzyme
MHPRRRQALLAIPFIFAIGGVVAWAGSAASVEAFGRPLFALCAVFSFAVNLIAFLPAYASQTERYFDLTGSLTYLTLVAAALALGPADPRARLLGALVAIWALRLGTFLFRRILQDGSDGRMDVLKPDWARFLMTWTLQGLWVFLTLSCALAAMTSTTTAERPLGGFAALGGAMWLVGFGFEAVADHQKRVFRRDPAHQGRFITTGLWAWSQHPNYFGEILLWTGIAVIAVPALSGPQYATLLSPVFVFVLLTRISGIPLLAARAQKQWGQDPAFRAYRQRTALLLPRPPGRQT